MQMQTKKGENDIWILVHFNGGKEKNACEECTTQQISISSNNSNQLV